MTASERLKALEQTYAGSDFKGKRGQYLAASLTDALPEIIAVVGAAERIRNFAESQPSQAVLFVIADEALAALDAKLSVT